MVLIRVGKHDVINVVGRVMSFYVLNNLLASVLVSTVNDVNLLLLSDLVANCYRVSAFLRLYAKKINFNKIRHR